MEIEILEMAERRARFILRNSSPAMANALRRTLLSDIPKMAIDKVEFHLGPIMDGDKEYESNTPLFDEIIAHRLGMVPVPTDLELFTFQDQCECGGVGCPSCTIMYSLNKHGPCTVLSGDLMPLGNPDLKVKDEFIPIVELTDGQAVMIYATAVMGTARKHVKWQVCNGVGYSYLPKDYDGHLPEGEDATGDPDDFRSRGLETEWDPSNFLFKFETDGSLTARQALDQAVRILADEARAFSARIEELE